MGPVADKPVPDRCTKIKLGCTCPVGRILCSTSIDVGTRKWQRLCHGATSMQRPFCFKRPDIQIPTNFLPPCYSLERWLRFDFKHYNAEKQMVAEYISLGGAWHTCSTLLGPPVVHGSLLQSVLLPLVYEGRSCGKQRLPLLWQCCYGVAMDPLSHMCNSLAPSG